MAPEDLRDVLRHRPFEPFRLVMTDGVGNVEQASRSRPHGGPYDEPNRSFNSVGRATVASIQRTSPSQAEASGA